MEWYGFRQTQNGALFYLNFPYFKMLHLTYIMKKKTILFAVSLEKRPNLSITKLECTKGQVDI